MQANQLKPGGKFPPSKMPVAAILFTLIGDIAYLILSPFFLIVVEATGVLLQLVVFVVSTLGVLGCVLMMGVRPRRHVIWGVLVLLLSVLAFTFDGFILVALVNTTGVVGLIWSIPLVLVLIGGILTMLWEPPS